MKKIVILGCENSHANTFLNFIKKNEKFKDVEVLGVYSHERPAAEKLNATYGVKVMDNYDEFVGQVDGVVVTARHGDNHFKYAKPYIANGITMFIDKPVTISEDEALEFMQLCIKNGVKVTGGSCLKYADFIKELANDVKDEVGGKTLGGSLRGPVQLINPHGGFYFYAQHLAEMVMTPFGNYPKSVNAFQNDKLVNVVFHYENYDIHGMFVDGNYKYYASRYTEEGAKASMFDLSDNCFLEEFDHFYDIMSGKDQIVSYKDFIAPVFVLNAIERSLASGKEEKVKEYSL